MPSLRDDVEAVRAFTAQVRHLRGVLTLGQPRDFRDGLRAHLVPALRELRLEVDQLVIEIERDTEQPRGEA